MSDKLTAPPHSIQIQIDPVTANGIFVNLAMVNHTETEFTLDLAYVQPQAPQATVRARAITNLILKWCDVAIVKGVSRQRIGGVSPTATRLRSGAVNPNPAKVIP